MFFLFNSDSVFLKMKLHHVFFVFKVMRSPMKRLEMNRISTAKEPAYLTKYFILERREFFRRNPPEGLDVSSSISGHEMTKILVKQIKRGLIATPFQILKSMKIYVLWIICNRISS